MSHTLSHTEILQASADELWDAGKHLDKIVCDLIPEYFAKREFVQGHGEPGSIRVITMGPAIPQAGQVKERVDKVDYATKTVGYTVLEGDPRYSSFSSEMQFVAQQDGSTAGTWTAKYEPVGDMGPPEHIKAVATIVMKTLVLAAKERKWLTHTETLEGLPDAIWSAYKNADEIACKAMPDLFESTTLLHGQGGPGSIRVIKLGPAIPYADEAVERMDLLDEASRTLGYTMLVGADQRYRDMSGTMQFSDGPREGTTTAVWVVTYVADDGIGPPENIKSIVTRLWRIMSDDAKADLAAQKLNGVKQ